MSLFTSHIQPCPGVHEAFLSQLLFKDMCVVGISGQAGSNLATSRTALGQQKECGAPDTGHRSLAPNTRPHQPAE